MGSEVPKQFLKLSGKPILMKTIEAFLKFDEGIHVILVLHPDLFKKWESLCEEYRFNMAIELIEGGEERYHSVKNGLSMIGEEALVAIHDGVRPLISQRIIADSFSLAARFGSAVPVTPMNETIRKIKEGNSQVIDRSFLFSIQTPQTFLSGLIKKAYQQAYKPEFTDDASLLESAGEKVQFFPGETRNIKITRQEDLALAEMLMNG